MVTPVHWRDYERHPLSAEYPDITGPAWDLFVENLRAHGIMPPRTVKLFDGKVIDGWQLQRACVEADDEPEYEEVQLPDGMSAEAYVATVNDHRRHETQAQAQKRIAERRDRVATARRNGKSYRQIANEEGVDEKTARKDAAAAGADQSAPGPEGGMTTGRDGKQYEAAKSPPSAGSMPETDTAGEEAEETVREEMRRTSAAIESFCRSLTALATNELPDDPWLSRDGRRTGAAQKIEDACASLRAAKCTHICPACNGEKVDDGGPCGPCLGTGRMPKATYDQAV